MLARWKEHFEEHLNEGSESEQPTRPIDLRDDGVDIDLVSTVDELLKNGGPNLIDALQKSGPRGYCVQCTRKAINSIVKTIEGFAS
jgi:hypothetical protein